MNNIVLYCTVFAMTVVIAQPLAAQKMDRLETELIRDREDVQFDRDKAYLLVQSERPSVSQFFKIPTDAERKEWARQREEERLEAVEKWPEQLARYQANVERYSTGSRRMQRRIPEMPVEPTDENFPWPDLERYRMVSTPVQNRFAKDDGLSVWILEVPPGEYVFYGSSIYLSGDCACLGSVRFKVEVGKITGVRAGSEILDKQGNVLSEWPDGVNSTDRLVQTGLFFDVATERAYDLRIPRDMIAQPSFEMVPALPNWFGGMVNRIQPIDGLFEYDRDRMVDLREPAPSEIVIADMPGTVAEEAELAAPEAIEEASIVAAVGAQTETEAPVE